MFLRDTNVLSVLRRPALIPPGLAEWAVATAPAQFISVVTLYEIDQGMVRIERRDPAQAITLRDWVERSVMPNFAGRILPIDTAVARAAAAMQVRDPRPLADAFIAATALVHGLTLATRNVRDFAGTGVALFDPWASPPA